MQPLAVIHGSTFDTNIASAAFQPCEGGAIFAAAGSRVVLANDLFVRNEGIDRRCRGGAIYTAAASSVAVRNCTFADNFVGFPTNQEASGGAIFADDSSEASVASSVFWANRANAASDDVRATAQAATSVTFSCMQTTGWGAGTQQLTSSPFASFATGNFRLASTSSCIDAADNSATAPDRFDDDHDGNTSEPLPFDVANKPRFVDYPAPDTGSGSAPLIDCGAYEKPRP